MTSPNDKSYEEPGKDLEVFCKEYNIRVEDFFQIVNDQKVIPMLRGKAAEYGGGYALQQILSPGKWIVNKLNLNPRPSLTDRDIAVTHRRTGMRLTIKIKNAVRGSMRIGVRSRLHKVPHFKVKCHHSRSKNDQPYSDRYLASEFDIIISTPINAIFKGRTVGEELELVNEEGMIETLNWHYGVSDEPALMEACSNDWRFVISQNIAEDVSGYSVLPRTPYVWLSNDPNWLPLDQIESTLEAIVQVRHQL